MSVKDFTNAKIAFVHGRPGPHPSHRALAESINADFYFVDRLLRYHDLEDSGKIKRYTSWILNSLFFPHARKYDLVISESLHFPPVIMKKLGILRTNQKTVALMSDEILFFLKTKWYPPKTQKIMLYALSNYDALICLSRYETDLANQVINESGASVKTITAHPAISSERFARHQKIAPCLTGQNLLFIANGPSGWRGYYKGMETLLETFKLIVQKYGNARLTVVGDWDMEYIDNILAKTKSTKENIHFAGEQKNLMPFLEKAALYFHPANGEAFGISIIEALRAGVPTIVSDLTGAKEVVNQVDPRLIVAADPVSAAERIDWYFNLSKTEKKRISDKGREVVLQYNEEKCFEEFRNAVNEVLNI